MILVNSYRMTHQVVTNDPFRMVPGACCLPSDDQGLGGQKRSRFGRLVENRNRLTQKTWSKHVEIYEL